MGRNHLLLQNLWVLFMSQTITSLQQCALLEFYNIKEGILSFPENSLINLTFWLNTSACNYSSVFFRIDVSTKTDLGKSEYEGKIIKIKDTCIDLPTKSLACLSSTGPAALNKRLNRSHVEIEWMWENDTSTTTRKELNILYPPKVKSLTVDGQEVNDTHLLNESFEVNISCSFEEGNPPAIFHLLDNNGPDPTEFHQKDCKGHRSILRSVRCEDDWPVVRCEGNGSEQNRSVSFLVKCPPQFADKSVKIPFDAHESITLRVKAHTTVVNRCALMPLSTHNVSPMEVNCTMSENPPNLVLNFHLENRDSSIKGWILTLYNDEGSANITLSKELREAIEDPAITGENDEEIYKYMPIFFALLVFLLVVSTVSVVLVLRMQRKQKSDSHTHRDDYISAAEVRRKKRLEEEDNESMVAVVQEAGGRISVAEISNLTASREIMASMSTSGGRNSDGLIYGDLVFTNTRSLDDVIKGSGQETEYAAINFGAIVHTTM